MALSEKVEELSRMLECPICLERMTSPRILPCLHSFCEKCIGQHMKEKETNGQFPCPVCATDYHVPENGVLGIRRNTFLFEVSELFPDKSEVYCEVCNLSGSQNAAVATCLQCKDHLCQECSQYHGKSRATASHQVVKLDEIRSGRHLEKFWQSQKTFCDVHKDEAIKIYCEDCEKPVCLLCKALDHDQHKMKNIEDATKNARGVIRSMMEPWKKAAEHSELLCKERKKIADNMVNLESEAISELRRIFTDCKSKVLSDMESEQESALKELMKQVQLARKPVEEAYNDGDLMRVKITSALKYADKVLGSDLNVQILHQFSIIKNRFEELSFQDVDTFVKKPVISYHPEELPVSDMKMGIATNFETLELKSKFTERVSRIPLDNASRLCCYNTQRIGDIGNNFQCFAANDKWFVVGNLYNNRGSVKVFDKTSCRFLMELQQDDHQIGAMSDVACAKSNIFVVDDTVRGVVRYDVKGHVVKVSQNLYNSRGYIACQNNQLALSDLNAGRLLIMDFDCNVKKVIDTAALGLGAFQPRNLCFHNNNEVVVIDEGLYQCHVINFRKPCIVRTLPFAGHVGNALAVDVDLWGNILVCDYSNHRVVLLKTPNGDPCISVANPELTYPSGLVVFAPGEFAVLENQTGNIKIYEYLSKGTVAN